MQIIWLNVFLVIVCNVEYSHAFLLHEYLYDLLFSQRENCCKPVWAMTESKNLENIDLYKICENDKCFYQTCGLTGKINGSYYHKSLPMKWSITERRFTNGNYYCGRGSCNLSGCLCHGGCQVDNLQQDSRIRCAVTSGRASIPICYYKQNQE